MESTDRGEQEKVAFHAGMEGNESQALAAEAAFNADSTNLAALASYLGYACARGCEPAELTAKVIAQIRWLIEHHPSSPLMSVVMAYARPTDSASHSELRDAWISTLEHHGDDVAALRNALSISKGWDKKTKEQLLRRVLALDPGDAMSSLLLARMIMQRARPRLSFSRALELRQREAELDPVQVAEAIAVLEAAIAAAPEAIGSSSILMELTKVAAEVSDWQKSELAAGQLLECVRTSDLGWMNGNAIFYGHAGIGRAALRRGDVAESKRRLLAALEMSGSPQLNSFGPDMSLAKELLELGEREVVLQFLEGCRAWWELHRGRLDKWKVEVMDGRVPNSWRT